eukprot:1194032-Prorocentrum_minimum.AAC.6
MKTATAAAVAAGAAAIVAAYFWRTQITSKARSPKEVYDELCNELKGLDALGGCKHHSQSLSKLGISSASHLKHHHLMTLFIQKEISDLHLERHCQSQIFRRNELRHRPATVAHHAQSPLSPKT